MKLLSVNADSKTRKSNIRFGGTLTAILYLAPADNNGLGVNLCPMAKKAGCLKPCLYTAGNASVYPTVNKARIRKARWFIQDQTGFMDQLHKDLEKLEAWCAEKGKQLVMRLNGTTDILWEKTTHKGKTIFELFPDVVFYDYTKIPTRRNLPKNYQLALSYSEANPQYARKVLAIAKKTGRPVAVVGRGKMPATFKGIPVVDGDQDDMIAGQKNVVRWLKPKGRAKKDFKSGFVING